MTEQPDPKDLLEFPCQYQFKAVGADGDVFRMAIISAVERHVSVPLDAVHSKQSRKGNYQSVSILVTLYSYEQLVAIYSEMRQVAGLKMLL